ncbi:hypothetical protein WFZ85_07865 [Flavobacterium sp. j3]|uniref:Uncharacterized protein n=1 Tax=Flavobacterium aureirubrum TaxID=3133147 RepID=A0ABU9N4J2_9FLAO
MKFGINNYFGANGLGIFAIPFPAVRHARRFLPSGLMDKLFEFL